jgi:hypothetical protein
MKRPPIAGVAHHEAGHAVLAAVLHVPFAYVTIEPDKTSFGHVTTLWSDGFRPDIKGDLRTRAKVEAHAIVSLAGPAAEARFAGGVVVAGGDIDRSHAVGFATWLSGTPEETEAFVQLWEIQARQRVSQDWIWSAIEAVAKELLVQRRLGAARVRAVVRDAMRGPVFTIPTERTNDDEPT